MKTRPMKYSKLIKFGSWRVLLEKNKKSFSRKDVFFPIQRHSSIITRVVKNSSVEADGVLIEKCGVKAGVYVADCLPAVFLASDKGLVLHLSRRSLVRGLPERAEQTVNFKKVERVYVGPHICEKHLVFDHQGFKDRDFYKFKKMFPEAVKEKDGFWYLSIRQALQKYLNKWNIKSEKIKEEGDCVYEDRTLASRRRTSNNVIDENRHNYVIVWRDRM